MIARKKFILKGEVHEFKFKTEGGRVWTCHVSQNPGWPKGPSLFGTDCPSVKHAEEYILKAGFERFDEEKHGGKCKKKAKA